MEIKQPAMTTCSTFTRTSRDIVFAIARDALRNGTSNGFEVDEADRRRLCSAAEFISCSARMNFVSAATNGSGRKFKS